MRRSWLLGVATAMLLTWTSAAEAATTIGQVAQAPQREGGGGIWEVLQPGAPSDGRSYAVPYAGVITTFRINIAEGDADDPAGPVVQLRVYRRVPRDSPPVQFAVVGRSQHAAVSGMGLKTIATRVPVSAGDFIGMYTYSVDSLYGPGGESDTDCGLEPDADPVNGVPRNAECGQAGRLNLEADVEPDIDSDGYGDETQDRCPGAAGSHQGCAQPTLSRATASAAARKALKRKRKKARSLRVSCKPKGPDRAACTLRWKERNGRFRANATATLLGAAVKVQLGPRRRG